MAMQTFDTIVPLASRPSECCTQTCNCPQEGLRLLSLTEPPDPRCVSYFLYQLFLHHEPAHHRERI